jgi:hypothetical protein
MKKARDPRDHRIRTKDGRVMIIRTEIEPLQNIPLLVEQEIRDNRLVEMARLMEQHDTSHR